MTRITSKTILARFPKEIPLSEACEIIREWDPQTIKCGYLGGIPYVYAESKGKQFMKQVGKMVKQGIVFEPYAYLPKFDNENVEEESASESSENGLANEPSGDISDTVISQILNELNNLKKDNSEFKKDNAEFRADNNKKDKEIAELHKYIAELRADNNKKDKQIDKLNDDIDDLYSEINMLREEVEQEKPQTKSLSKELNEEPRNKSPSPKRPPSPKKSTPVSKSTKSMPSSEETKSIEKPVEEPPKAVEMISSNEVDVQIMNTFKDLPVNIDNIADLLKALNMKYFGQEEPGKGFAAKPFDEVNNIQSVRGMSKADKGKQVYKIEVYLIGQRNAAGSKTFNPNTFETMEKVYKVMNAFIKHFIKK